MNNSDIEYFSNAVKEVKNVISDNLSPIDLFLLLSTRTVSNAVMIKLDDSTLSVINIHNDHTNTTNINKLEQTYYWVGQWLNFLKEHDTNFDEKSFDYQLIWKDQTINYNIQAKVDVVEKDGKPALSHFSIILRIKTPENFIPIPLPLDAIHAYYIDQKLDSLNINNKEDKQKNKI